MPAANLPSRAHRNTQTSGGAADAELFIAAPARDGTGRDGSDVGNGTVLRLRCCVRLPHETTRARPVHGKGEFGYSGTESGTNPADEF